MKKKLGKWISFYCKLSVKWVTILGDLNLNSYNCKRKAVLSGNGLSAYYHQVYFMKRFYVF